MSTETTVPKYDELSDEDFMNQSAADIPAFAGMGDETDPDEDTGGVLELEMAARARAAAAAEAAADGTDEDPDGDAGEDGEGAGEAPEDGDEPADGEADAGEAGDDTPADGHTTPNQPTAEAGAEGEEPKDKAATAEEPTNYEELYKQIMGPIKANGREFTPGSPEEAVRLMQMGANYTKKMQALKPNLKLLRMLENNGLLKEDKIAHLIDLDQKNPLAIQKLLRDGKVDPMDLDTTVEPDYKPGNHSVSDAEMVFHEALDNVRATPTGLETIQQIDKTWDQASKQEIYAHPHLLQVIDDHRANGLFDRISGEVERRKTLGDFSTTPFIHAYKAVGDELHAKGQLVQASGSTPAPSTPAPAAPAPVAVDTRPARTRKPAATREQVRAVSAAPGNATRPAKASFNPLTMSDEEIMAMAPPQ